MSTFEGTYVVDHTENFEKHLQSSGFSVEQIKAAGESGKSITITTNGESYTIKNALGERNFPIGKEVQEDMGGKKLKSVASLEGDSLVISSKDENGKTGKRVYEFSDPSKLVVTLSSELTSDVGKIFYNAV